MTSKQARHILCYAVLAWIVIIGITIANAATVYTKQAGTFEQCKSAAGSVKYHCITGTGCKTDTLKCVPPVPVCTPPSILNAAKDNCVTPACPQYTTGIVPNCKPIPCGDNFIGNEPNCIAKICEEPTEGIYPNCVAKTCKLPLVGVYPACALPPVSLMPFVDLTKEVLPAKGYDTLRLKPDAEKPSDTGDIAWRIRCGISHMSKNDPLVAPNQEGATHHHTFFGNTSTTFSSDLGKMSEVGNSTCDGGIMNRSGYWHPSMINGKGAPLVPQDVGNPPGVVFYYKSIGSDPVPAELVVAPPKGLRMLAGNPKATTAAEMSHANISCLANATGTNYAKGKAIPNCNVGDSVQLTVTFPRCWDNKNLDSPNHQDHMAYASASNPTANKCPASHPIAIPEITFNMRYQVKVAGEALSWRLASDNYQFNGSNAGYSLHADWVNGYNQELLEMLVKTCINAKKDCHSGLTGDGRRFY